MPFRFLEDIVTADVAFEAAGKTPEELFVSAAEALEEAQVNTKQLANSEQRTVNLENDTLDKLLFDFLDELIFYKDAESLVFADYTLKIEKGADKYTLKGTLKGEKLDPERHELRTDVKAVTKHRFGIEKMPDGYFQAKARKEGSSERNKEGSYKATVVLDI